MNDVTAIICTGLISLSIVGTGNLIIASINAFRQEQHISSELIRSEIYNLKWFFDDLSSRYNYNIFELMNRAIIWYDRNTS